MKNKLGISAYTEEEITNKIYNFKFNILDESFTFNCQNLDIKYLQNLHEFLFGDVMPTAGIIRSAYNEEDIKEINLVLSNLKEMLIYRNYYPLEEIKYLITDIINMQLFDDGNNRLISAYLKQLCNCYILNELEKSKTFSLLTKSKLSLKL